MAEAPCLARSRGRSAEARDEARALLLLCLVLAALAAASAARKPRPPSLKLHRTKLIPRIYKMEDCTDKQHSFRLHNITSTMAGPAGTELYDMDFELLTPAKQISQLRTVVHRCTGVVSANMCELFQTFEWSTAICDLMTAKHMAWSTVTQMARPPFKCPLHAGAYTLRNASFDLDAVDRSLPGLNLEKYIWLSECQIYDEDRRLHGCMKWVTEARRVRIKEGGLLG